jgi:hypothetical protein
MSREFVVYRGVRMIAGWPERIVAAQAIDRYTVDGVARARVRYGDESEDWGADAHPCHDCRVLRGEYHVPGCDAEQCPACGDASRSCDCDTEWYDGEAPAD